MRGRGKRPAERGSSSRLTIVVDTREQLPYAFRGADVDTARGTLASGDYSISGLESEVTVERKSLVDLFGTVGRGRARFERELERMSGMSFAAIVVEATLEDVLRRPPQRARISPRAVVGSLLSWQVRYGVHVVFAGDRRLAESTTLRLLEKYVRERSRRCQTPEPPGRNTVAASSRS